MEKNKQVILNMTANIVSYSVNIIVQFILTPFLIAKLGKETYSFYPIATTIISYMSVLTNAMNAMASRYVTISIVKNDNCSANKYYSSAFAATTLISLLLVLPLTIIVLLLDKILDIPISEVNSIKILFMLVFMSALLNIMSTILGIATFAKNRIDLRSIREIGGGLLKLILFFVLYYFFKPSIVYVGLVGVIVAVYNIVVQKYFTTKLLPDLKINRKDITASSTKELFSSSIWNAIITVGNLLVAGMSLILANLYFGAEISGTYSIVNVVPQFINGVISMLVGVFYPLITYKYAENDINGLIIEVKNTQKIVGAFGGAIIAVFISLSSEFFDLWILGEDSNQLFYLSSIVIIPHIVISCMWILTNLNIAMNKVRIPAVFTLFIGIANIIISFIVCKIFKCNLYGIAVTSTILQVLWVAGFLPLYASYNLKISYLTFYPNLFKTIFCVVTTVAVYINIKHLFDVSSWGNLLLIGVLFGIFSVIYFIIVLGGFKPLLKILKIGGK